MYPKEEKDDDVLGFFVDGEDENGGNHYSTGFDALGTTSPAPPVPVPVPDDDDEDGDQGEGEGQGGIWDLDVRAEQQNLLHEINDPPFFYNYNDDDIDHFPQIPDNFPCMSSSSSSSSVPAPAKPVSIPSSASASASSASSSTSSAASWAMLKSDGEGGDRTTTTKKRKRITSLDEDQGPPPLGSVPVLPPATADGSDCMGGMENLDYMDLVDSNEFIDSNDFWDPSALFMLDENPQGEQLYFADQQGGNGNGNGNSNGSEVVQEDDGGGGGGRLDELGTVFFEWLKSNKDVISAQDMRNIKIKKSTVESASKRLGSSKEGKKQLLKLILDWVQQYQLQRKSAAGELPTATAAAAAATPYPLQYYQGPPPPPHHFQNPNFIGDPNHGYSSTPATWMPPAPFHPQYMADQSANGMQVMAAPAPQPPYPYVGVDPYNPAMNCHLNMYGNQGSGEYQVLESPQSWNPSQITMAAGSPYSNPYPDMGGNNYGCQMMPPVPVPVPPAGYPNQYPYGPQVYAGGDEHKLMRLDSSSATREARKKRMARQRRLYSHHHHHRQSQQQNHHNNHVGNADQQPNATTVDEKVPQGGNWMYWQQQPPVAAPAAAVPPQATMEAARVSLQQADRQAKQPPVEKRQGLRTEKNLKFLLQKVLKQSDVGNLGRIVLPKKEAETHLPELDTRDGISISMEDIGTSRVWNMRYSLRFWPNNKSRMYLLENTGDFVKTNGLQEGDFIVIYSDVKCGKYLIRGVKVRQPATAKSEGKKPIRRNQRAASQAAKRTEIQVDI